MPAIWSQKAANVTMGQTGSAQREPSMEEILASIRRIIQDSDTVQQPVDGEPDFETAAGHEPDTLKDIDPVEVDAFRAELDEQVSVTSGIPHDQEPATAATAMHEAAEARSAQIHSLRAPASAEPEATPSLDFEDSAEPAVGPVDTGDEGEVSASAQQQLAPATSSIISDQTGRQVAAAFGELSDAFAASRRRSFDDMAQEMLRPMLQDWLDNNLPTLVERLVREEIERVARGG